MYAMHTLWKDIFRYLLSTIICAILTIIDVVA